MKLLYTLLLFIMPTAAIAGPAAGNLLDRGYLPPAGSNFLKLAAIFGVYYSVGFIYDKLKRKK